MTKNRHVPFRSPLLLQVQVLEAVQVTARLDRLYSSSLDQVAIKALLFLLKVDSISNAIMLPSPFPFALRSPSLSG